MMFFHIKKLKNRNFEIFGKISNNFDSAEQTNKKTICLKICLITSFRFSSSRKIEWRKREVSTTNIQKVMNKSVKNGLSDLMLDIVYKLYIYFSPPPTPRTKPSAAGLF